MHTDHPGRRRSILRLETLEDRSLLSVSSLTAAIEPPTAPVALVQQVEPSEPADPALAGWEAGTYGQDDWDGDKRLLYDDYLEDGWEWSDDEFGYCVMPYEGWIGDDEFGDWAYTCWVWDEDYEFGEWDYELYDYSDWEWDYSDWEWDGEWEGEWMITTTAFLRGNFAENATDGSLSYTTTIMDGMPLAPAPMPVIGLAQYETAQVAEDYSAIGLALGDETPTPTFPTSSRTEDVETTLPNRIDASPLSSTTSTNSFQTDGFEDEATDSPKEISSDLVAPIDHSI